MLNLTFGRRRLSEAQQILQEAGTKKVVLLKVGARTEILSGVKMSSGS